MTDRLFEKRTSQAGRFQPGIDQNSSRLTLCTDLPTTSFQTPTPKRQSLSPIKPSLSPISISRQASSPSKRAGSVQHVTRRESSASWLGTTPRQSEIGPEMVSSVAVTPTDHPFPDIVSVKQAPRARWSDDGEDWDLYTETIVHDDAEVR